MNYWEAMLLGVVQGIAEFLPISSDGHLVLVQTLMGHRVGNLAIDVALHVGTLLSILVVYFRDLLAVLKKPRLILAIVVATIPLVFVGLFVKDYVEAAFASPLLAGVGLCITSVLLFCSLRIRNGTQGVDDVTWRHALVIGLLQCLAIGPGISRSGSTIVTGMLTGLKREAATTFSFFIAVPAICGAAVLYLKDLVDGEGGNIDLGPVAAGTLVAFVVGVLALKALIRVVAAGRLHWFAWYCLVVGIVTIIVCTTLPPVPAVDV